MVQLPYRRLRNYKLEGGLLLLLFCALVEGKTNKKGTYADQEPLCLALCHDNGLTETSRQKIQVTSQECSRTCRAAFCVRFPCDGGVIKMYGLRCRSATASCSCVSASWRQPCYSWRKPTQGTREDEATES